MSEQNIDRILSKLDELSCKMEAVYNFLNGTLEEPGWRGSVESRLDNLESFKKNHVRLYWYVTSGIIGALFTTLVVVIKAVIA